MKWLARIFAFLLLAIFAAATVAHSVAAAEMSLRMAVAADVDMDDCDGCDETSDAAIKCDQTCVQPFAAVSAPEAVETIIAATSLRRVVPREFVGRVGPPERHPPR